MILAFMAMLHWVIRKLRACPAPSTTQARKVHSSDLSQVSYYKSKEGEKRMSPMQLQQS